ncbi:MAG: cation:proton antiporter [bacterium]|nr:cation:proton antiporter [bacterium]
MDYKILAELIIISAIAIPVVLLCRKMKIPVIVGFLLSGIIINPSAAFFKNILSTERIDILAELGVICLLFSIGLEFSLKQINDMKKPLLIGGTCQVAFTIAGIAAFVHFVSGMTWNVAIFYGCVISLSSTALVLSFLQAKGDISKPYGRNSMMILIYQDIASVVMVILCPLLENGSAAGGPIGGILINLALKFLIIIAISFVAFKWIVPKLLYNVAKTQSRELFLMAIMLVFLSFVAISGALGISLALGAFIAGVIIAESPYNHRALGVVTSFKDIFTSIFFVSIGIMLDFRLAVANIGSITVIVALCLVLKAIIGSLAVSVLKCTPKTAILTGIALCQIGEFAFVLFKMGYGINLINKSDLNIMLASAIMTMILTPFILQAAPKIYDFVARYLKLDISEASEQNEDDCLSSHVIIVGFGIAGRRVAFGAKMAGLPYCVIESNPDTVKTEASKGVRILYGDAAQEAVLEHAGVKRASIAAITMPETEATKIIAEQIRRMNSNINIIARAQFEKGIDAIVDAGATSAVSDEKEASFGMLAQILKDSMVERGRIREIMHEQSKKAADSLDLAIGQSITKQFLSDGLAYVKILKGSPLAGKSLAGCDLRKKYGIIAAAIDKGGGQAEVPNPDEIIKPGYNILFIGAREKIKGFMNDNGVKKMNGADDLHACDRS